MKRKPNVLIMVDSFDMGGAESQAVLLARLLLKSDRYGVHLACLKRQGVLLPDAEGLGLEEIPEFRLTSFYDLNMIVQLKRLVTFLRKNKIDVVHPQSFYTNVFAITAAALARVPARIAFRGETAGWRSTAQDFVERCSYRLSTAIHANSEAVRDYLLARGVSPKKIVVVYNGLDMDRVSLPPNANRIDVLRRLGLEEFADRQFVTIVANMHHEVKDHPTFLRAAARVHEAVPEAMFLLVGEGELRERLQEMANEFGLRGNAVFAGQLESVAELLFVSNVCVLSSTAEGFSNSILEYMAAARPVVATAVGGAPEAVVEGETGYLVNSGDHEAMGQRIIALLREPERARALGTRGREVIEEKFSSRAQLVNTERLYDCLLTRRDDRFAQDVDNVSQGGAFTGLH
jgi:L-malate glycosyltransferase